ncbi:MAG: LUD domain-containing protein [Mangrovibacterium sp.]|nr:LUD domain-containing protein [Mangrovibacterium sp.]
MPSPRENILRRLKDARDRRHPTIPDQPDMIGAIYTEPDKDPATSFQEKLEELSGIVHRVTNLDEAAGLVGQMGKEAMWKSVFCLDKTLQQALKGKVEYREAPEDFDTLQTGITPCEFLVAHLGSVMVSSGGASGRRLHVFPETHIVIAHQGQLVWYLDEALARLQGKYKNRIPSMITTITGASRTADIEKTLVKGMHGPRKLIVLLCEEPF